MERAVRGAGCARRPVHRHALACNARTLATPITACTGDQEVPTRRSIRPGRRIATDGTCASDPLRNQPGRAARPALAELRAHNVRRAVVSADLGALPDWIARAPGIVVPANAPSDLSASALRALRRAHAAGKVGVFAEFAPQYIALGADDPSLEPFWALAERLDVPVGIHLGDGMARTLSDPDGKYRAALTSPFQLETVLIKHPGCGFT